jgi:secreted PhoX family phosphatase
MTGRHRGAVRLAAFAVAACLHPGAALAAKGGGVALVPDPKAVIDLPAGFTYTIISRMGDEMDDGLLVPALCDGMAAFPGPDGTVIVVRNHEGLFAAEGPFGEKNERLARVPTAKLYDLGLGITPCPGGTTTFVWDPKARRIVRQFLSLAGTLRNCAGGATPWGSWLTCEEITLRAGSHNGGAVHLQKDHGYVFDVPATATPALAEPVPLKALGRFYHEGAAVDPRTGIVYMTEDLDDGLIYRFIPDTKGDLSSGRLQALALESGARDSRNWEKSPKLNLGEKLAAKWIDMNDVDAPKDDLRIRGHDLGACLFARPEGIIVHDGTVLFTSTSGGLARFGQVWRYTPGREEGTAKEKTTPGTLDLFVESSDAARLKNPDNLVAMPSGEIMLCEDPHGAAARLVIAGSDGALRTFALARLESEFAGATFSPDGSTLFVNLQMAGLTLAVEGPWSWK